MGLAEQKLAGGLIERTFTEINTDTVGSGSIDLNSSYMVLSIQSNRPCRFRLYDDSGSRDDTNEINRTFGDTNIAADIALVADFSMSVAGNYTTDPVLYGVTHSGSITHYRIEPASPSTQIRINTYTIEDKNVPPTLGTPYSVPNRKTLPEFNHTLTSGSFITGSFTGDEVPKTYLLVSASLSGSGNIGRLRLYSNSSSLDDVTEVSRSFSVEPSASSYLIADMILSGSETNYFTPKIVGANLSTLNSDLREIAGSRVAIDANNEVFYILKNETSSTTDVSASVHVYSLED